MRADDLAFLMALLHRRSGLSLTEDKAYLLESRLTPLARSRGMGDLATLVARLRAYPDESLLSEVTEAMTTNETSFFRDGKPFEHLRKDVLPQVRAQAGSRRAIRIWNAACSTGQEPYSVAMLLLEESAKHPGWTYEIVATDLSAKVIEKAREGIYTQFEAQRGMPIKTLLQYFSQRPDTSWQAKEALRAMVTFRPHNLLTDPPPPGLFDIVFCRNVLIYFDEASKSAAIDKLSGALQPGGYFILGSTESIFGSHPQLSQPEGMRGIYRFSPARAQAQPKRNTSY